MPFHPTPLAGVRIFQPLVHGDERGYFAETYNHHTFAEAGIGDTFVQDNEARSAYGVLRGLHYQKGDTAQSKLVRVVEGKVYDVVVDLRRDSPTLHRWFGIELSGENKTQLYVPRGFAHGYLVLSRTALFVYKCDNRYAPTDEAGLRYDDPTLGIEWPTVEGGYRIAARDREWPLLKR